MKSNRINYIIVGCFVMAIIAGLVIAVAMLSGRTGPTDDYHALYNNVSGVEFGTRVLYEGFPVGQVERVTPEPAPGGGVRFRVDLSVTRDWAIPTDSIAEIVSSGLLAAVTIGLRAGKAKESLKPGSRIPSREPANVLAAMSSLASEISELTESDIRPLIATIRTTVAGVGELINAKGGALVTDVQGLTRLLNERAPALIDDLGAFTARLNTSADKITRVLSPANVARANRILGNLQTSSANMAAFSDELGASRKSIERILENISVMIADNRLDLDRSVVDMRHAVESIARHIDAINQNLEGASRNMYEFSRQLRQNPGLLLGGTPPKDEAASP